MRAPSHAYRGFTLIELITVIVIIAILAAVALPSETAAVPFAERGYADTVTASIRQARLIAFATRCDVQFIINAQGYTVTQRAPGANNRCAPAPAPFSTAMLSGRTPSGVVLASNQQFVFSGTDGAIGAAVTITLGPQTITLNASGVVQ